MTSIETAAYGFMQDERGREFSLLTGGYHMLARPKEHHTDATRVPGESSDTRAPHAAVPGIGDGPDLVA